MSQYGYAAAAVQIGHDHPSQSCIFYQNVADESINARYSATAQKIIVTSAKVREGIPIAAVAMDGEFNEVILQNHRRTGACYHSHIAAFIPDACLLCEQVRHPQ